MIIEYKGKRPKISATAFIAPTAVVIGDVTIGDEASVWWGAVLRSDQNANPIIVGARTSVQDNCVIHSGEAPTIIEEDCTIGHGAIMEGPLIRRRAIIGMNVTLLENTEIGEEALIAAGSVVVPHTKIPPRVLAAGSPAKVKKEISGAALNWIRMGSATYIGLCRSYLGGDYKIIG
ncbi:MAG: gamma carbonic anhydrase family protein [Deltaproteobacteria bacterium]|jgi:carbonic anhydrase/acetyltransferase-like protein (isoleucine patch superfamily)